MFVQRSKHGTWFMVIHPTMGNLIMAIDIFVYIYIPINWVGGFNPSEQILHSQLGNIFPTEWKYKIHVPNTNQ